MPSDRERVAVDAELLAAARRHYAGRGDVADQLWWAEHPGSRGPSGAEDPLPALEARRAGLYRPDRPADVDAATLQRDLDLIADDRAAAREALERATADRPGTTAPPHPARSRPLRLAVGVGIAALLVGAGAGFAAGRFTRTPAPAALGIFDVAQRARDRPPATAELPPLAARSAYRLIDSSSTTGAFAYGVRTDDGDVCLVLVVLAQDAYSTCTTEPAFATGGLTLSLSADVDPQNDSGVVEPVGIRPHWSPDGEFTF